MIALSLNRTFASAAPLQVCGESSVWGDGVVPVPSAHLDGAINITLEGVYHSPLGADPSPSPGSSEVERASPASDLDGLSALGTAAGAGGAQSASLQDAAPRRGRRWYGSPEILDFWVEQLSA